jgi:PAS domain S-box-containing protein
MIKVLEQKTEPYRKFIGWTSTLIGIVIFIFLYQIYTLNKYQQTILTLNNKPLVIYIINDQKEPVLVNWPTSVQNLLGWTKFDVITNGLGIMIPDRFRAEHQLHMGHVIESEVPRTIETYVLHKNGGEVPVTLTVWVTNTDNSCALSAIIRGKIL